MSKDTTQTTKEPDMNIYYRPLITQSGKHQMVKLFGCDCGDKRRGPKGGVCGNCGRAIPDENGR